MISKRVMVHQYMAMLPAYMVMFMAGLGYGWVAPLLPRLKNAAGELSLTTDECAWIASLQYLSRMAGSFLCALLLDRIGRSKVIILALLLHLAIWIMVAASKTVLMIYLNRVLFGISFGLTWSGYVTYITENCSPHNRGSLVGVSMFFYYFGQVTVFCLFPYFTYDTTHMIIVGMAFVCLLSTVVLKETPQYLIMKGDHQRAERNFRWFYALDSTEPMDADTRKVFEDIRHNVEEEQVIQTSMGTLYKSSHVIKSLRISFVFSFLGLASGFVAVNSFIMVMLRDRPTQYCSADHLLILFGVLQLLGSCLSPVVMDRFNRRSLIFASFFAVSVMYALTVFFASLPNFQHTIYFTLCMFFTVAGVCSIYACAICPLLSCVRGEVLSQSVKSIGTSIGVVASSISGFLTVWTFLPISEAYGAEANFALFSVISLLTCIYVYYDVPETRGKTLVNIQNEMKEREKK